MTIMKKVLVKFDDVAPSCGNGHLKNFFAELAIVPK